MARIDKVKKVIEENIEDGDCGLFFTRNWIGDPMKTIWQEDGVVIDICYPYSYFEVFGLTHAESDELSKFYEAL